MKKRIKYYVCLLAILVTGTSLSRASSGSDMSITAASAIESLHAKSLHIAYATGILAMPSAVFLHAATAPALSSAIVTGERDLLFAPPPPPDTGTGGGGAVGEAPIRDCVWLLVLVSLGYIFLATAPGLSCLQRYGSRVQIALTAKNAKITQRTQSIDSQNCKLRPLRVLCG